MAKRLSKSKIQEAVRVVGYLLETNSTTKVFARNKKGKEVNRFDKQACKFCLVAASDLVAVNVLGISQEDYVGLDEFQDRVDNVLRRTFFKSSDRYPGSICYWDSATRKGRKQIAWALRSYSDRA